MIIDYSLPLNAIRSGKYFVQNWSVHFCNVNRSQIRPLGYANCKQLELTSITVRGCHVRVKNYIAFVFLKIKNIEPFKYCIHENFIQILFPAEYYFRLPPRFL